MSKATKKGRSDEVTQNLAIQAASNIIGTSATRISNFQALENAVKENAKAISELQTIPTALEELKAILLNNRPNGGKQNCQFNDVDDNESEELVDSVLEFDSVSQMANNLIDQCDDDNSDEVDDPEILSILGQTNEKPSYGPNLQRGVAESISRLANKKASKEETDKWKEMYKPPENCKLLGMPKVNNEIWSHLGKGKIRDLSYQQFQLYVSTSTVCFAQIAEKIVTLGSGMDKKARQELLQLALDGAAMSCVANNEISMRRRADCRQVLPREMGSICSASNPVTENLFGDNVMDQIKNCKSTANLMKSKPTVYRQRSHPYRQLQRVNQGNYQRNYRAPPRNVPRPAQRGPIQKKFNTVTRPLPAMEPAT